MKRRDFGKLAGSAIIAFALSSFVTLTGCAASNVAAAIIASFGKVLGLLKAFGISVDPNLVSAIQAALTTFQDAYDAFQKGTGTAEKLAAAAQAALTDIENFLAQTNIGGPIANVVVALLQIILSTLMSFIPTMALAEHNFKLTGRTFQAHPITRTLTQYKSDWNNACLKYGHKELEIK